MKIGGAFCESSAKTNHNVENVFFNLVREIRKHRFPSSIFFSFLFFSFLFFSFLFFSFLFFSFLFFLSFFLSLFFPYSCEFAYKDFSHLFLFIFISLFLFFFRWCPKQRRKEKEGVCDFVTEGKKEKKRKRKTQSSKMEVWETKIPIFHL